MHIYGQNRLTRRWDYCNVNGRRVLVAHWSIVADHENALAAAEGDLSPFRHAA